MGQFRSYNRHEEKKNRLVLSVFAREVEFVEDDDENMKSNADFPGRIHMQTAGVPENSTWQRNRRSSDRRQPAVWKIGLHSVHLLGQKCQICICFSGGRSRPDLGQDPEPGIREKNQ